MHNWGGKNPNNCKKWLNFAIFPFWLGGQVGEEEPLMGGGNSPSCPPPSLVSPLTESLKSSNLWICQERRNNYVLTGNPLNSLFKCWLKCWAYFTYWLALALLHLLPDSKDIHILPSKFTLMLVSKCPTKGNLSNIGQPTFLTYQSFECEVTFYYEITNIHKKANFQILSWIWLCVMHAYEYYIALQQGFPT